MDDENSQDELINHNTSLGKGKRAALWTISDDSDDAEEETEEGESDSGEEDEKDGHQYGEDEEDVEDDEEEEGEDKAEDGAFGGASAELAGMSSDEDTETCPICLNSFSSQPVATPENCLHYFCLDCILEWAKNANSCPVDRTTFESIYLRKCYGGKVKKMITVQKPVKEGQEERVDLDLDQTNCGVCGGSDREDHLLLCDGCDAGYHMECLTPPLDSVPVEEWFCPECEANNRHSRGSEEEHSDRESIPSTARPATSYSQSHATAPTRAIARTQQSERVRANVNRHRITQARTSQLAPTYLIQSTWLDETINAVVAGLNTSVYVRDFTPRVPSGRRRTTKKRRNIKRKKTSSGTGKPGSTGIKRRKRKVRRTKSRRKLVLRKTATPRSRIANNLGIVKDKKSSSLPTVYRPTEYTLSGMRANIGAASLSIYVDPFDLDPFVDLEEEAQQAQVTSLMEAKRRGISRSALRSHQPVARPVTASHSRRVMDVPQSGGVVEAAPVPDLLGSILSGQSMLLMDSSDVIINRDGSLKATKPTMTSELKPGCSSSSCSTNAGSQINPVMSPNHGDDHLSPLCNGDLPGFLHSSMNRTLPQITSLSPSLIPSTASHIQPSPNSGVPAQRLGPPCPIRHTHSPSHRGADRFVAVNPLSIHATRDSSSKNKEISQTHLQSKKAPPKPMWVDVSELPRIPKVKKESSNGNLSSNNQNRSTSTTISNGYGMPEKSMNSLAGDKGRLQSVEQRKGKADGQAQRPRPDASTSSSTFSNSFSSSSTAPPPSSLPRYSSSSSTSSAVSFRINSSGNSWRSRRLNAPSSSNSGGSMQEPRGEKKEEARKRRLHKDKQMLLASRAVVNKEQDSNNIYDPFNPTLSESSSSEDESECTILEVSSQRTTPVEETPSFRKNNDLLQSKQDLVPVKSETQETGISVDQQNTASAQATVPEEARCSQNVMVKKEPRIDDTEIMKQTAFLDTEVKEEQGIENPAETEEKRFDEIIESLMSQKPDNESPIHHLLYLVKTEKESLEEESGQSINIENADSACPKSQSDCSVSNSAPFKNEQKADSKSNFKICSKSPSKDMVHTNKASQVPKERCSSSPETDSGRRGDHHASGKTKRKKVKKRDQERSTRRSRSRDRRRAGSTSESSQSASLDKTQKKRERSRSRSKDRRRTRSVSSSSSRERSRKEKHEQKSKERRDEGERYSEKRRPAKNKRRGRSRSRSQTKSLSRSRSSDYKRGRSLSKSKSRSRSRSRERRKGYTRQPQLSLPPRHKEESGSKDKRRHRSRSSSRERRKKDPPSKSSQKSSSSWVSSPKDTKELQTKKKEKKITQGYLKEENAATVYKQDTSTSTTAFEVKHEEEEIQIDSHATVAEIGTQTMFQKEIKKEKRTSLDMFEDHPLTKPIKEEKIDAQDMMEEKEELEHSIKTEMREIAIIKSEPISTELCHIPSVTLFSPRPSLPVSQSRLKSLAFADQPNTFELTIPIKEEAHQLSGFDDEFNVDVMLDVLDSVKSESTDSCSVKQEKDEEKGNNERGQVLTVLGAKSKTQVKRVTWNIQEPEGPQPEKSASKVALYKLRLKQEGVRRPTSTGQTSAQEITGVVTDPSRKSTVVPLCSSSQFEGVPEVLLTRGQGEPEEGDLSRKDKYLRKLNMQERAVEEVKLAIKPFYQRRDISKDEYKEILRKAVQKVCHSKSGKINPVKVGNLVKAYVDKYKHARKHKKGEDSGKASNVQTEALVISESP